MHWQGGASVSKQHLNIAIDGPAGAGKSTIARALADKLGALDTIYNDTLTCYNGIKGTGCGDCPACFLRKRGYDEYMAEKNSGKDF